MNDDFHYGERFRGACQSFISEIEAKCGPLKESQKQGIYNAGTFMFLEVMMMQFDCAKTEEDLNKFLSEIDGFTRET